MCRDREPHVANRSFYVNLIDDDPANGYMSVLEKYPLVKPNLWLEEMLQLEEVVKATDRFVFDIAMLVLKHAVIFPSV